MRVGNGRVTARVGAEPLAEPLCCTAQLHAGTRQELHTIRSRRNGRGSEGRHGPSTCAHSMALPDEQRRRTLWWSGFTQHASFSGHAPTCPTRVGSRGSLLNTGASVTSPCGFQKPLVVKSVSGQEGSCSSSSSLYVFLYCGDGGGGRGAGKRKGTGADDTVRVEVVGA